MGKGNHKSAIFGHISDFSDNISPRSYIIFVLQ